MSTLAPTRPRTRRQVSQARVVRSEWIKLWSLRSTVTTLAVGVFLLVGIGLLASSVYADGGLAGPAPGDGPVDAVGASLAGTTFAQLAFGTLGVLLTAGEYGTGMIRSSMAAVPRRLPVLWAKIVVFTGVVLVLTLAATAITFAAGQAIIGDGGTSWSDPGVARALVGTAVVLTLSGVLGIGLGALLRSTPTAITTLFGVMFLLSGVAQLLFPESWSSGLKYLPANASTAFTAVTQAPDTLTPWAGLAVFGGYVVAVVVAAAVRLKRSDV
ncbi:ABC transporter permease [Micromonospora cathayae]|uniref:ABC transporter permease n=1 Tax=Micromonospora cathayae TaxID=3028804 RepID=A0ABY7ZWB2_9ACTN|nr:ABC transporter permease [Micromonospora sp. HUAS 3]WDZ87351.1 ABC transporter permease [Micromonospora sp. HUAS 3]